MFFTEQALMAACKAMRLPLDASVRGELMEAYLRLAPLPEVKQTLTGMPLAISNGSPGMLEQVVKNVKLDRICSQVITVDEVKTYEPSGAA
jgi:2-haloacid dehalogenase